MHIWVNILPFLPSKKEDGHELVEIVNLDCHLHHKVLNELLELLKVTKPLDGGWWIIVGLGGLEDEPARLDCPQVFVILRDFYQFFIDHANISTNEFSNLSRQVDKIGGSIELL